MAQNLQRQFVMGREQGRLDMQPEIERLRKEHDDLLTKALGVEAERDIARDEIEQLRKIVSDDAKEMERLRALAFLARSDAAEPKSDTGGKEHGG